MVKECFLRAWKATKFKGVEFQWVCIRDLVVAVVGGLDMCDSSGDNRGWYVG